MLSFRSILFAAAAFATFTSAIPAPAPALPIIGDILGGVQPVKRDERSAGDIFHDCRNQVGAVIIEINAAVRLDVVDVNTVVGLLNSIVGIVGGALGNLKMVEGGGPLTLGGQPLSIVDFGDIVGGLLSDLISVFYTVGSVLGFTTPAIWNVINSIGSILNELLEIVLSLVDGLVDPILGVLNPYRDPCKQVGLASLFLSLGVTI